MVLVLMIAIVPAKASANTGYNHNELLEYKGYGESMYEAIVEETTFITGQYTDNKEYVGESINQVKDYANFWLDEQKKINNTCGGTSLFTKSCAGELVSSGGGYLLTVGDWVKKLFSDYDESENVPDVDYSFFENALVWVTPLHVKVKTGWQVILREPNGTEYTINEGGMFNTSIMYGDRHYQFTINVGGSEVWQGDYTDTTTREETTSVVNASISKVKSVSGVISNLYQLGGSIRVLHEGVEKPYLTNPNNKPIRDLNNYIQTMPAETKIPVPQLKPLLVCPSGEKIQMTINGSTFLNSDGTSINVQKDGTASINNTICNLDWEKPEIKYIGDTPVMETPDNKWMDLLTGDLMKCLITDFGCGEIEKTEPVKPLDNSLLAYIKNAYIYATESLKVATDGLKSLANGAKELTSLFGVFFSWLPREMVVLMSSGLGLMIALRLFRK